MDITTLFRIVHPKLGTGPWHSIHSDDFCNLDHTERELIIAAERKIIETGVSWTYRSHPPIWEDICGWKERFLCATLSIEQLKFWFNNPEVLNSLFDAGFTIFKITVPAEHVKIGESGKQVAYDSDHFIDMEDITLLPLVA